MEIKVNKATIKGEEAKKIITALKQTIEAITEEDSKEETEDTESNNDEIPDKNKLVADLDELRDKIISVINQLHGIAESDGTQLSIHLANTLYKKGIELGKCVTIVKSFLDEYNLRKPSEQE